MVTSGKVKQPKKLFYQRLTMPITELESKRQFKCTWVDARLKVITQLLLLRHYFHCDFLFRSFRKRKSWYYTLLKRPRCPKCWKRPVSTSHYQKMVPENWGTLISQLTTQIQFNLCLIMVQTVGDSELQNSEHRLRRDPIGYAQYESTSMV